MRKVSVSVTETLRQLHMGGQWEAALETCHFLREQRIRIYPESLFLVADSMPRSSTTTTQSSEEQASSSPTIDDFVGVFCHPSEQPSLKALYNRTRDPTSLDIVGANMNYCSRAYHWNDALRLVKNCNDKGVTKEMREALMRPENSRASQGILVGLEMIATVSEQHAHQLTSRGSSRSSVPWLVVAKSIVDCATFTESLGEGLPVATTQPLLEKLASVSRTVAPMCDSWRTAMGLLAATHCGGTATPSTGTDTQALLQALCRMSSWWSQIQTAALSHINAQDPTEDPQGLAARLVQVARTDRDALDIVLDVSHGPSFIQACSTLLEHRLLLLHDSDCMDDATVETLWCRLGDAAAAPASDALSTCYVAATLFKLGSYNLVPSSQLRAVLVQAHVSGLLAPSSPDSDNSIVNTATSNAIKAIIEMKCDDTPQSIEDIGNARYDRYTALREESRAIAQPPPKAFIRRTVSGKTPAATQANFPISPFRI